jgi:hypothetical protein
MATARVPESPLSPLEETDSSIPSREEVGLLYFRNYQKSYLINAVNYTYLQKQILKKPNQLSLRL